MEKYRNIFYKEYWVIASSMSKSPLMRTILIFSGQCSGLNQDSAIGGSELQRKDVFYYQPSRLREKKTTHGAIIMKYVVEVRKKRV